MAETPYQAAIFDLDDTILKSGEIKWRHHKYVAKTFWGIDLTDETLAEHWGKPFDELVGHLYQNADTVENMIAANRQSAADYPKQIQADAAETLDLLKLAGIKLGIVTAITTEYALNDLKLAGIPADRFLFVQGADKTSYHKPDPRVFGPALALLEQYGISKNQTVYVGDALSDYFAARDAKIDFIGVATGFVALSEFIDAGITAAPTLLGAGELIAGSAQ